MTMTTTTATPDTIDTNTEAWRGWVRRAQTAMKAAWTLGDIATEVTADASYGDGAVAKLAAEVGIGVSTLRQYRQVAEAYGAAERSAKNPWSIHMIFAGQEDRVELVKAKWTASEARAEVKRRRAESAGASGDTSQSGDQGADASEGKVSNLPGKATTEQLADNALTALTALLEALPQGSDAAVALAEQIEQTVRAIRQARGNGFVKPSEGDALGAASKAKRKAS